MVDVDVVRLAGFGLDGNRLLRSGIEIPRLVVVGSQSSEISSGISKFIAYRAKSTLDIHVELDLVVA